MNKKTPDKTLHTDRRNFLKAGGAAVASFLAASALPRTAGAATAETTAPASVPANADVAIQQGALPTRNLGKTGYRVGIFSLGGQGSLEVNNNADVAVPIIERALDLGVNYLDTSSIYGGPSRCSEHYLGQVMKTRRKEAFVASKTKERSKDESLRRLDESLKYLNTDHLDLWQLHDMGTMADVDAVFAKGGAMEALLQARDQKMVKYLGITGHHRPDALMELIKRFPFDTILLALNAADVHYFSFKEQLLPMAVEKQMGIIGMKVPARGRILSTWTPPLDKQAHSWEGGGAIAKTPGTITMQEAMHYTLSLPVSTVIIGCDTIAQLEENVKIAREFTPLSDQQMAAMNAKVQPVADQSLFFRHLKRA